eukprot:292527-Pyramimonas_sp.AAC.1
MEAPSQRAPADGAALRSPDDEGILRGAFAQRSQERPGSATLPRGKQRARAAAQQRAASPASLATFARGRG